MPKELRTAQHLSQMIVTARHQRCAPGRSSSGDAKRRSVLLPPIGHDADAEEAKDHHRPGGGFGNARGNGSN